MLETKSVFGWLLINMNWKKPNKKQKKTVNHENLLLFLLKIFELPPIKQPLLKKAIRDLLKNIFKKCHV